MLIMVPVLVCAVVALAALYVTQRAVVSMQAAGEAFARELRSVNAALVVIKGVPAHHADPETFGPNGVSWDAVKKAHDDEEREGDLLEQQRLRTQMAEVDDARQHLKRAGTSAVPRTELDALAAEIEARLGQAKAKAGKT